MAINRITEVTLGLLAMLWGAILMAPGDLFAGIERYKYFNNYAPDTGWGIVLALCGLVIVIRLPKWAHRHAHWVLCTVWLGMFVLSLLSTISPPALLIASLLLAIAIIHATKFFRLFYSGVA